MKNEEANYIINKISNGKAKRYLKSIWGKKIKRKINFENIERFVNKSPKSELFIDKITCNDLNIKDIFCLIDRTLSTAGEHILYYMLRNPLYSESKLKERNRVVELFRNNMQVREKVQLLLYKLGRTKGDITSVLYTKMEEKSNLRIMSNVLTLFSVGSLLSLIIMRKPLEVFIFLISFLINMSFHSKLSNVIKEQVIVVKYIGDLINVSSKLSKIKCSELDNYIVKLKDINESCSKIGKKSSAIGRIEGLDVIGDYINILFLTQERNYFSVLNDIEKNKEKLTQLYFIVGEIDALCSIASYREGLDSYVEPIFVNEPKVLNVKNAIHPLVKNAVPNSIEINNRGVIITGSNMAGKSTFLRTLAVNALLAQTIYTCFAEEYKASFFKLITSIEPQDNIIEGKSYYLGEAEAVLRVVKACRDKITCLTMIDEIFRGTNPVERINAAAEIMDYLNQNNAIAIVATHDLVLTKMVKNYDCYYFREHVSERGLTFDYLLKKGISPTRNAIRLLKLIGYPDDIIQNIEERIKNVSVKLL